MQEIKFIGEKVKNDEKMEKGNTGKKSEETKEAKENRSVQKTQITGSSISRLIVCCDGRKHIDHTHSSNMCNSTYKLPSLS